MSRKKWMVIITAILLFVTSSLTVFAADAGDSGQGVVFEGGAEKFVLLNGTKDDFTQTFKNMMPGEERVQDISLTNEDKREMQFYFGVDVLNNLGSADKAGAVYEISFSAGGEVFYQGLLGGEEGTLKDLSDGSLGKNVLLADLKKGESTNVRMTMKLDGDSMDNSYQNSEGKIRFRFGVEYDETAGQKAGVTKKTQQKVGSTGTPSGSNPVEKFMNGVKTGDNTSIAVFIIILGLSAAVIAAAVVFLIVRKKNNRKN